jgi:hypothetical protein
MDDFQQGIKVDDLDDPGVTAVVRVAPRYDTLKCLQESLVHAEKQAKALLERVGKVLGPRGFTLKAPDEALYENGEYFVFVFVSADLDKGDVEALQELMGELADLDGWDDADDPDHLGKVTDDEFELGRMYRFVDRDGDIYEGKEL